MAESSKSISLEEFREKLDTDAQRRCKEQEKTIRDLIAQNKQLYELLKDRQKDIQALQNRCYSYSRGLICLFCGMRNSCRRTIDKEQEVPE